MPSKASTDASLVADRFQLSLSSMLSIARSFREPLHFREADGIASILADGTGKGSS